MTQNSVNLTIRSTIKKIDEITFRCPLGWTIYQLKAFIAINHQQGSDYFKPAKTQLYFIGNNLKDQDTVADVLKDKSLKQSFTFIAKFVAGLESEEALETEEEYIHKNTFLNEYSQLISNPYEEEYKGNTNIDGLDCFSKLPLMADSVSKHLVKAKILSEEPENKDLEPEAGENEEDDELDPEHQYMIKLGLRILITFFLFKSYFHGALFVAFLAALGAYFLIKVNQRRAKQRRLERQNQQNQQNQQRAEAQNEGNQVPNENPERPREPENPIENLIRPTVFARVKELVVCFVSSFYPSWDVNLYIENHALNQAENNAENPNTNTNANPDSENNENIGEDKNNPNTNMAPDLQDLPKGEENSLKEPEYQKGNDTSQLEQIVKE